MAVDWKMEVRGFYSRPEDSHSVINEENVLSLPLTVKACNRNSLVAVGDESGAVRLIESAKDEAPGFGTSTKHHFFNRIVLTPCRENLHRHELP